MDRLGRRVRVVTGAAVVAVVVAIGAAASAQAGGDSPVLSGLATWHGQTGTVAAGWGKEARLWSNSGTVSQQVTVGAGATVSVQARATACQGLPELAVKVDGARVAELTFPATSSYQTLQVGTALTAGTHTVSLTLRADRYLPLRCDRNAYVGGLSVAGGTTTPPTTPTSTATAVSTAVPTLAPSGTPTPTATPTPTGPAPTPISPAPTPTTPTPTSTATSPTTGRPDASTTGVRAGVALTTVAAGGTVVATDGTRLTVGVDGTLVLDRDGLAISGYDIQGTVWAKANRTTVTDCRIRGMDLGGLADSANTRLYSSTGTGNLIAYSDVAPDAYWHDADGTVHVDSRWIGLGGGGFTADHLDVSKAVDLLQTTGDDVTLTSSYLHDNTQRAAGQDAWLNYAFGKKFAGNPSHSDGWQVEGGSRLTAVGNTFLNSPWTAILLTQNVGRSDDVTIHGNWMGGGSCTINLADNKGRGAELGVTITDNVFTGAAGSYPTCFIISKFQTGTSTHPQLVVSGNTSTIGGSPDKVWRGAW